MRDAIRTREKIIRTAGELFNVKGYSATSISDITSKTGFTKGAIYRHFKNKSELEKEVLMDLTRKVMTELRLRIKKENNANDKLHSILKYYLKYLSNSIIIGGCPLMNAAIEVDDTNPAMRRIVGGIMTELHHSIAHILRNGIKYGQIDELTEVNDFSTVFIASLEGGIMMSELTGNSDYINGVIKHLSR